MFLMVRKYQWHEIAGTELPQYTFIPNDLEILKDDQMEPFNLSQKPVAWYLDKESDNELYIPLFEKTNKSGEV